MRTELTNIAEVARAAGVSTATVSRFLAGRTIRSEDAVRDAIARLGYAPSAVARSLKSGRHQCIGVIVPDISNPFFAALVKGIETEARSNDLQVILGNSDEDERQEYQLLADLTRRTDGIIMAPLAEDERIPDPLLATGFPIVFVDRDTKATGGFDRVMVDNATGVRLAIDHLAGLGHARIAAISGPLHSTPGRARHEAFLEAMAAHGLPVEAAHLEVSDFRESGGHDCMTRLWHARPRPSAVFVANNLMTIGALKALRALSVRMPDDISVLGFDDLSLAPLLDPPLTVVNRPEVEQGAEAARLLVRRLAGDDDGPPRHTVLPVELLVRSSTGPCAPTERS
ncbi:MAG: LacI family DNA-binding transcriptional regulator [Nocardioidaceae bacterium]